MRNTIWTFVTTMMLLGVAALPSVPAAAAAPTYTDAAAYCRAIGTIAEPDGRYRGPVVPQWMERAAGRGELHWRCQARRVLVCAAIDAGQCENVTANRTPTPAMQQFCRQFPNESIPYAYTGHNSAIDWNCRNGRPVGGGQTAHAGFNASEWKDATQTTPAAAQGIPATPEQFVRMLYARLGGANQSPFLWQNQFLSKRTALLYQQYVAATNGEIGAYFDSDWLCQCQDPGGYKIASLAIAQTQAEAPPLPFVSVFEGLQRQQFTLS